MAAGENVHPSQRSYIPPLTRLVEKVYWMIPSFRGSPARGEEDRGNLRVLFNQTLRSSRRFALHDTSIGTFQVFQQAADAVGQPYPKNLSGVSSRRSESWIFRIHGRVPDLTCTLFCARHTSTCAGLYWQTGRSAIHETRDLGVARMCAEYVPVLRDLWAHREVRPARRPAIPPFDAVGQQS